MINKVVVKEGLPKAADLRIPGQKGQKCPLSFLLRPGPAFLPSLQRRRGDGPNSGSNIHLLWIHDGHGVYGSDGRNIYAGHQADGSWGERGENS